MYINYLIYRISGSRSFIEIKSSKSFQTLIIQMKSVIIWKKLIIRILHSCYLTLPMRTGLNKYG